MDCLAGRMAYNCGMAGFFQKGAVKWFILLAVFFGTVAVIFVLNDDFSNDFQVYSEVQPLKPRERNAALRVTIDFGNGKKRAFEAEVASPLSAAEALRATQEVGKFTLKIGLNGEITEIDRVKAAGQKRWHWYLNGNPEERPILDVMVRGGDKVLVRYQ